MNANTATSLPTARADDAFDVRYGYWFNRACESLYSRIDFTLNLIQLVGGSGAALAAINHSSQGVVISGLLLACCAAISLLLQPSVKAYRHSQAKAAYIKLEGEMSKLDRQDIALRIAAIRAEAPSGISSISFPACNAALRSLGRDDQVEAVGRFDRFIYFLT